MNFQKLSLPTTFFTKNVFKKNSIQKIIVTKKNCHQNSVFFIQLLQPKKVMKKRFFPRLFHTISFFLQTKYLQLKMFS